MNLWKWLLLLGIIVGICTLSFIIYQYKLVSQFDEKPSFAETADAGIVLGAALWDDEPSPALMERLEVARQLFADGKVSYLILSGGLGNDRYTEAEAMKKYLVKQGVPENRLILESKSHNTKQNLENTKKILEESNLQTMTLITHDYHMTRALLYADKIGIQASSSPVHSKVLFVPYHKVRECLALIKYKLGW